MKETVYIFTYGALKRKDDTLFIEPGVEKKFIPVEQVKEIYASGEIDINKMSLDSLTKKEKSPHGGA